MCPTQLKVEIDKFKLLKSMAHTFNLSFTSLLANLIIGCCSVINLGSIAVISLPYVSLPFHCTALSMLLLIFALKILWDNLYQGRQTGQMGQWELLSS
jgi:hypothetical protein